MPWRKSLTTLHLWVGLIASPFLIVLGVTGAIMVFEVQLNDMLNAKLTRVEPKGQPLSVVEMARRVAPPKSRLVLVQPPVDERHSYGLGFAGRDLPPQASFLFVDQYTGRVLGAGGESNTLFEKIHSFHLRLLAGRNGATVVIAVGIALLFLSITGLILWWPGKILRFRWSSTGPRLVLDMHKTLGAYSWIFLMLFSLTAIVIHWDDKATRAFASVVGGGTGKPFPPPSASCGTQQSVSADSLLALAGTAVPGARVTALLLPMPKNSVARLLMKYPEDGTPAGRTILGIEGCTGRVVYAQTSRDAPVAYRMAKLWNREIHTGDIFGWPTRILAALMSLTLPLMALTGPLIWWTRRRKPARV